MLVADLMTDDVVTASPTMTLKDVDRLFTSHGISGAPVLDDGMLVGVISQSDVIRVLYDHQVATTEVSQFLLSPFPIPLPALEEISRNRAAIADRMVEMTVGEAMTSAPVTVAPADDISAAANAMVEQRLHRVLVTDAGGALVGILSALDLAALLIDAEI
jgi:CBS domain-containing protein